MSDFKTYLATEVVSEQRTISYRNVSRALQVHVNAAKCMLYEFYEQENKRKPGSIYATYLIAGIKRRDPILTGENGTAKATTNGGDSHLDEDEEMLPSSPPPFTSSMLEPSQQSSDAGHGDDGDDRNQAPTRTVTLVREEALEGTTPTSLPYLADMFVAMKEQYEKITSVHIYSLSPSRIPDLVTLTDISRGLFSDRFVHEDPLIHNKTYGVIQNADVRRRTRKRSVGPHAPAPKFQALKNETTSVPSRAPSTSSSAKPKTTGPPLKKEESSRPSSRDSTSTGHSKPPGLKRDASDFFKSAFRKQNKKPQPERKDTDASTNASASGTEDVKIEEDADEEGESEDEALFLDTGTRKPATKKRASDVKKEREDKAAKLRKMMESDNEEPAAGLPAVEDAADVREARAAAHTGRNQAETGEDEAVAWSDSDTERQRQTATRKETSAAVDTAPRRRRGKRKVMKKRTMKDEEGYLVTKEEAVWESFSEDEPESAPAEKQKPRINTTGGAGSGGKSQHSQKSTPTGAKGGGAKKGGNIMSFFGKK